MLDIFLLLILAVCVITDVKSRKIYNKVIYPALLVTFAYHLFTGGVDALGQSFIGFLIGFGLLLIPYMMGGMGAGDVKLLALVGALKGGAFVFESFFYIAIIGAAIALGIIVFRSGVLKQLMFALLSFRTKGATRALLPKGSLTATYPYGVAIAGGAVLCLVFQGGWMA
ncbi:A24 family peptidase [Indiicoccus explosivorum]|uniref:A24 family peptidase n=1 Tax=Indiicoccus explosivorum TaxID=1917864 RepID=UPI000B432723|nr:prepilin peptidase [Indiicoccus explosivorum]